MPFCLHMFVPLALPFSGRRFSLTLAIECFVLTLGIPDLLQILCSLFDCGTMNCHLCCLFFFLSLMSLLEAP